MPELEGSERRETIPVWDQTAVLYIVNVLYAGFIAYIRLAQAIWNASDL